MRQPPSLLGLVLLAGLAGCAHRAPHRYFQPTAAQIGPEPNSYGEAVIPRHGLVAVQGDDFAYGLAQGRSRYRINGAGEGQARITISETLRRAVKGVTIENRGFPGDTAAASAVRWADAAPADLTILSLGLGDAAAETDLGEFGQEFRAIVRADLAHGAVFVVIPPPSADPLQDSREGPYRGIAAAIGREEGAVVFDSFTSINRIKLPKSKTDAQPAAAYQAVAADMAPYIRVVDGAASPQAGQEGSGPTRTVRDSPASAS